MSQRADPTSVPCPSCGAGPHQCCVARSGKTVYPYYESHSSRYHDYYRQNPDEAPEFVRHRYQTLHKTGTPPMSHPMSPAPAGFVTQEAYDSLKRRLVQLERDLSDLRVAEMALDAAIRDSHQYASSDSEGIKTAKRAENYRQFLRGGSSASRENHPDLEI